MLTSHSVARFWIRGKVRRLVASVCIVQALWWVWGCAKKPFDGVEYRDREVAFRLGTLPAGLQQLKSDDALVTLQDDELGVTMMVGARCGQDSDDIPLRALVQHLFIQFTDRHQLSEREFQLDGRAALEMEIEAKLDGVSRHFVVTVLKKDGCVYDMVHVDGGGQGSGLVQSRQDFRTMVSGFHTLN